MADLVISVFGGIRTNVDPRVLDKGEFAQGQNFEIDPFGSLTKRNGFVKIYTTAFAGAITGIAQLLGKNMRYHNLFIGGGSTSIEDPIEPPDGEDEDDDDEDDDPPVGTALGCCNYGPLPGLCKVNLTDVACFNTYNGRFWREDGTCAAPGSVNTCQLGDEVGGTTSTSTSTSTSTVTTTSTSSSTSSVTTTTSSTTSVTTSTSSSTTTTPPTGYTAVMTLSGAECCNGSMLDNGDGTWDIAISTCARELYFRPADNACWTTSGGANCVIEEFTITLGVQSSGSCTPGNWTIIITADYP